MHVPASTYCKEQHKTTKAQRTAVTPSGCRETREALGLDVAGSVVIIDEAHNLLGAINGAHSVALSADSLASMSELLGAYYARFQSRLGPAKAAAVTLARGLVERVCTFLAACGSEVRRVTPAHCDLTAWLRASVRVAVHQHTGRAFAGICACA